MPRESNYFEEGYALTHDSNPIVARTAVLLYRHMLNLYNEQGLKPDGHFNIHYFFQSFARVIAAADNSAIHLAPIASHEIKVFNLPESLEDWSERYASQTGLLQAFVSLIVTESDGAGDLFDAQYALTVIALGIDRTAAEWIRGIGTTIPELAEDSVDFDDWLSGFKDE